MKIDISRHTLGLWLMISVILYSIIGLTLNEGTSSGAIFYVYKLIFYCAIATSVISIYRIKDVHILIKIFFIFTLIPIFKTDPGSSEIMLGERYRWLFYTSAIILADISNMRIWIKLLLYMMILNILAPLLFPDEYFPKNGWDYEVEKFSSVLLMGGMFIFGLQKRLSIFWKAILYASFIVTLLIYLYYARRTSCAYILLFVLSPFITTTGSAFRKLRVGIVTLGVAGIIIYMIIKNINIDIFEYFIERIDADSRTEVDLLAMAAIDAGDGWWWGLGVQGGYPNPILHEPSFSRTYVETGILDVIMDGGLILWISMMIMSIYAFLLGCFKSNNDIIRNMSYVVLVFVLMQYPVPQPGFGMSGFMIFTAIGLCYNKQFREYTDEQIYEIINL